MTLTYRSKRGKVLEFNLATKDSGFVNGLRFETRNGYLYFFDGEKQIFPPPQIYEYVRRFQILANNQTLEVAA